MQGRTAPHAALQWHDCVHQYLFWVHLIFHVTGTLYMIFVPQDIELWHCWTVTVSQMLYLLSSWHICAIHYTVQSTHHHQQFAGQYKHLNNWQKKVNYKESHRKYLWHKMRRTDGHNDISTNLTFTGPCTVIYFYSKTNSMHRCLKFVLLEQRSTRFGWSFHPPSAVQDCTYSNRHLSNRYCWLLGSKQTAVSVWLLYVQSWTADDGQKDRLKHVECHFKIK